MAYYDALIVKWATLSPGTTQQKLDQINALTVAGQVPTTIYVSADQVANCISWAEFKLLAAQKQSNLLSLLNVPGELLGGSAHTDSLLVGMLLDAFPVQGTTIANLTLMSKAQVTPWWQATVAQGGGELRAPAALSDLTAAGGLS